MTWQPEIEELERRRELALRMGGPERVQEQHDRGKLTIRERIDAFCDPGSFRERGVIAGALSSSLLLSLVKTPVGFLVGAFLGTVALLLAALVIIRLIPDGISAPIQRWLDRGVGAR